MDIKNIERAKNFIGVESDGAIFFMGGWYKMLQGVEMKT